MAYQKKPREEVLEAKRKAAAISAQKRKENAKKNEPTHSVKLFENDIEILKRMAGKGKTLAEAFHHLVEKLKKE